MFSVERFRDFVNERLTAAAEEIWAVFLTAVVEYEAEINRQRRMLDIVWKPHIHLHRIDVPQQHVCKEEEVLAEQQLCHQERKSSLDQEEPEPPQIKEEQEGEQIKQEETDMLIMTPKEEESEHREADGQHELQLLSHNFHVAETQDPKENQQKDSEITGRSKLRQERDRKHTDERLFSCEVKSHTSVIPVEHHSQRNSHCLGTSASIQVKNHISAQFATNVLHVKVI
ncbi:uncharacterized protein LOC121527925 isoform X4 [Cheilinus undulatus]|uniref:uncharacterized protein LOC121527925 isoform X4 n=1 Tax=Cheilinus undulatus TaxID=241271 RepID=UPI001BD4213F|nr:uncharacterized protein LOC121527925 isoform X4 [Cheilinus undulatus]